LKLVSGRGELRWNSMKDLALHILDIVSNGIEAGAGILGIEVLEDPEGDRLMLSITDDGCGMTSGELDKVLDPFYTTRSTRRVGLGLPLLAEDARAAEGDLVVDSKPGFGTTVRATFRYSHPDRIPLGNIEATLMVVMAGHPDLRITFRHSLKSRQYRIDSGDLSGLSLPDRISRIRATVRSGEDELMKTSTSFHRISEAGRIGGRP
jgi:hypothetical protein